MKPFSLGILFAFAALTSFAQTADCPMHAEHSAAKQQAADTPPPQHQHAMEHAQHEHQHATEASPYTNRTALEIKALTPETIDAYRNGTGAGMAIPAELNGYPGPRHVLDMADEVKLTDEQRTAVQAIYDRMHAQAVPLGAEIIELEQKLDRGFSQGTMSDSELKSLTRTIADRQGQLRFVHLEAHLALKKVLTPDQVQTYVKLRGYTQANRD